MPVLFRILFKLTYSDCASGHVYKVTLFGIMETNTQLFIMFFNNYITIKYNQNFLLVECLITVLVACETCSVYGKIKL